MISKHNIQYACVRVRNEHIAHISVSFNKVIFRANFSIILINLIEPQ